MPRKTDVADVCDVYMVASKTTGIDYNSLIDLMTKNRVLPFYEKQSFTVYKSDMTSNAYGYTDGLDRIFLACLEEWDLKSFDLVM